MIIKSCVLQLLLNLLVSEHITKIMPSNVRGAKRENFDRAVLSELVFSRDMESEDGRQSGSEAMATYDQGIIFANLVYAILMSERSNLVILRCARIFSNSEKIRIEACINMDFLRMRFTFDWVRDGLELEVERLFPILVCNGSSKHHVDAFLADIDRDRVRHLLERKPIIEINNLC